MKEIDPVWGARTGGAPWIRQCITFMPLFPNVRGDELSRPDYICICYTCPISVNVLLQHKWHSEWRGHIIKVYPAKLKCLEILQLAGPVQVAQYSGSDREGSHH